MAEASVAVKKPKTIPPMTIKSNKILGSALIKLEMIFLKLLLFKTGYPFLFAGPPSPAALRSASRRCCGSPWNRFDWPPRDSDSVPKQFQALI